MDPGRLSAAATKGFSLRRLLKDRTAYQAHGRSVASRKGEALLWNMSREMARFDIQSIVKSGKVRMSWRIGLRDSVSTSRGDLLFGIAPTPNGHLQRALRDKVPEVNRARLAVQLR